MLNDINEDISEEEQAELKQMDDIAAQQPVAQPNISEYQPPADEEPEDKPEEKPVEAVKEEKPAEPDPAEKKVPLAALHEAREINRELREELQKTQRQLGQFETLKDELKAWREDKNKTTQVDQQAEFERQFEEDPIAALRRQNEELKARIEANQQEVTQEKQQQQELSEQQREFLSTLETGAAMVKEYASEHKDYPQAFQFLIERRTAELNAIGITNTAEVQKTLNDESIALTLNAVKRGINPGETVYKLATARGYAPTELDKHLEDEGAKKQLDKSLERLQKGVEVSKTLSTGGGGSVPAESGLSLTEIERMSDDEFDKLWDQMSGGNAI